MRPTAAAARGSPGRPARLTFGRGVANAVSQRVTGVYEFVERMAASLGIDPERLIQGLADRAVGEVKESSSGVERT